MKLTWTKVAPKYDGFYFYRTDWNVVVAMVKGGSIVFPVSGLSSVAISLALFSNGVEWAGPIPEPQEADHA